MFSPYPKPKVGLLRRLLNLITQRRQRLESQRRHIARGELESRMDTPIVSYYYD
jgi:hypothetical protein